jgi:hypothetical protein
MSSLNSPYQYNADKLPDSKFERGTFEHIVVGNEGRALDYRRTPVRIKEIRESSGLIVLEILEFEDKGNTWEAPFEAVGTFQFALEAARTDTTRRSRYETIAEKLNKPLAIACDPDARRATLSDLSDAERDARKWVQLQSTGLRARLSVDFSRTDGLEALYSDTAIYMRHCGLEENEARFAADYACKFHYSENVKAQRIVMAEMGLVPYEGTIVREEREHEGRFSRVRRREHILRRMGYVRALYRELGFESVLVYRGIHCVALPARPRNRTFVSSTTNLAVAESLACFREPVNDNKPGYRVGVLMSQQVPLERVFMTYMETAQMNNPYKESEVVLLYGTDDAF